MSRASCALPSCGSMGEGAQLVLRRLEHAASPRRQLLAGAVDVERQHRHRRAVRRTLASLAALRRARQRTRDLPWIVLRKHATLQIQRVALPRYPLRPTLRACRRARAHPARRVRAAFFAAAERSAGPFVRAAFLADAERLAALRLLAAACAWRASARGEAAP